MENKIEVIDFQRNLMHGVFKIKRGDKVCNLTTVYNHELDKYVVLIGAIIKKKLEQNRNVGIPTLNKINHKLDEFSIEVEEVFSHSESIDFLETHDYHDYTDIEEVKILSVSFKGEIALYLMHFSLYRERNGETITLETDLKVIHTRHYGKMEEILFNLEEHSVSFKIGELYESTIDFAQKNGIKLPSSISKVINGQVIRKFPLLLKNKANENIIIELQLVCKNKINSLDIKVIELITKTNRVNIYVGFDSKIVNFTQNKFEELLDKCTNHIENVTDLELTRLKTF